MAPKIYDGLLDFLPPRSGQVPLGIAMDEQTIAGISFEGELDLLLEAPWNFATPQEIGVDHVDTDASAMRTQQPLKDGDQHLAIGWPVGHQGEPKCIHSGSSPK